ncbi:hypothetical protein [Streptomyces lydicus]|uniref:hypothetical protein n=1 Tax=Streptomyces lydicus TaxID=47763 RepID=UPI0037A6824C
MIAALLSAGLSACATDKPAPDRPTPGRSGSEDGSQTSAGTPGASGGGLFVFYTYRASGGVEYLDLLNWTTRPGGTVAGTYTAVLLSKGSPGGETRRRHLTTPAHADSSYKAFCNTTGGHGDVTAPSYTGSTDSVYVQMGVYDGSADGHTMRIRLVTKDVNGKNTYWPWHANTKGPGKSLEFTTTATNKSGIFDIGIQVARFEAVHRSGPRQAWRGWRSVSSRSANIASARSRSEA